MAGRPRPVPTRGVRCSGGGPLSNFKGASMTSSGTLPYPITDERLARRVGELGFELVELRRRGRSQRPVLELRIDRSRGGGVTVGDCALVSRALEEWLDAEPGCPESYVLEVSSPGVERRLTRPSHFQRFRGRRVTVRSGTEPFGSSSRLEGELLGLRGSGGDRAVRLRLSNGTEVDLPSAEVAEVRLVFDWNVGATR